MFINDAILPVKNDALSDAEIEKNIATELPRFDQNGEIIDKNANFPWKNR